LKLKLKRILIFFLILFSFPALSVTAQELEAPIREFSSLDQLYDALPKEVDRAWIENLLENENTKSLLEKFLNLILSLVSLGIREGFQFFLGLCAILLLGAILEAVKGSFLSFSVQSAFDLLFLLVLAIFSYSAVEDAYRIVHSSLTMLHAFISASLPVSTILLSMSGAVQTASIQNSHASFVVALVSALVSHVLLPMIRGLFALNLVSHFTAISLDFLLNFLKKLFRNLCVFSFSLLSAFLAMQNALASAADSLSMRSVRFAAGNFIPVVGPLVGEAAKTLSASLKLVRTECGILCLSMILYALLRPILFLWVQKTFLGFAAGFAQIIGEKKGQSFLSSFRSILDLLMALILSEGVYFVFYVTLFLTSKGSLV